MTQKSMSDFNILEDPLYAINKMTLKSFGRWPYQSRPIRAVIVFTACFGVFTVVIPEVIFFAENIRKKDMNKIVDCIPNLIFTYAAYVMIFNSIFNYHKMQRTLFKIKDDWMNLKEAEEIDIFRRYATEGKLLIMIYLIATSSTLLLFCTEPLIPFALDMIFPLNESRPVRTILEVQYFVDVRKFYIPIYLHNLQAAYFVIFTVLTFDFYFIMVVQHSCSMFATLGCIVAQVYRERVFAAFINILSVLISTNFSYRIANIDQKPSKMEKWISGSKQKQDVRAAKIAACIEYHLECIEFAELIESTVTVSWILHLSVNMIVISFVGVQTITRTNDIMSLLKYAMTTGSVIIRLFYISWPGQKIVDHSSQVHDDVCNIPWYNFPRKSKRLLLPMLLRSSRPCYITAGKMIYLNFETYCTLMKTSGSFFTMILSTQ